MIRPGLSATASRALPSLAGLLLLSASLVGCQKGAGPISGNDSGTEPADSGATDSGQMVTDAGQMNADGGNQMNADGGIAIYISSITPPNGPVSGGNVVVILGGGFANGFAPQAGPTATLATKVTFGGQIAVGQEISVVDDSTIQLTVPSGDPGAADVQITNPNGTGGCTACYTYYGVVQLNSITPNTGTTQGGTPFTLSGTGFSTGMTVLFGGARATIDDTQTTSTMLTGTTPPGPPGSANVAVISTNTASVLQRAFVYVAPLAVESVSPSDSPLAGGGTATVTGTGFTLDCQVSLGSTPATTTYVSSTSLTVQIPAATSAGAVSVNVTSARAQAALPNGFAYYDATASALQILSVSPQQGPVSGCSGCLQLTGSGFPSDGTFQVAVGVNQSTHVSVTSTNTATVDLPPATAPGIVGIFARASNGNAALPNSFAYVSPLSVTAIAPATGPASGTPSVTATLTTTGFGSNCSVFVGAGLATVTSSTATSATITVPPGSTGPADVTIACGTPGTLGYQTATLSGGFTYTAPVQILQVAPNSGSIAGNTAVTVFGDGFGPNLSVMFGDAPAVMVNVISPFEATVRTPPGNVGFVDVSAVMASGMATLPGGFGYFNPKNSTGGGSGGPMNGILNVTVLNDTYGFYGNPVPGVTISINADQLLGKTDVNGQVTFSDSSLLKPVNITAIMTGFETITVANINARDVTIYMPMTSGGGTGSSSGPPPPPPAVFTGNVCGFKLPPSVAALVANKTLKAEAQVFFTYPYVYAAPPFGFPRTPVVVSGDCGTWQMQTSSFGATAIYAVFGVVDGSGNFLPYLMTVNSNLQAVPGQHVTVPLVLNMHLDLTVPITILVDGAVTNQTYSYLDLGGDGIVPLASTISTANTFSFTNHPDVAAQSVVFLNLSYIPDSMGNTPNSISFYYTRQQGELGAGVSIGPMLPFTNMSTPGMGGNFSDSLGWTLGMGPQPDLQQIGVYGPDGSPVWEVVLPGTAQGVSLPPSAVASVGSDPAQGAMYTWTLLTASSPRFDFNYFSYNQLGLNAWTAFTQNQSQFQVP